MLRKCMRSRGMTPYQSRGRERIVLCACAKFCAVILMSSLVRHNLERTKLRTVSIIAIVNYHISRSHLRITSSSLANHFTRLPYHIDIFYPCGDVMAQFATKTCTRKSASRHVHLRSFLLTRQ
eukprot:scaffold18498_cov186-Amphora_coffeaeformis.AAC.6